MGIAKETVDARLATIVFLEATNSFSRSELLDGSRWNDDGDHIRVEGSQGYVEIHHRAHDPGN